MLFSDHDSVFYTVRLDFNYFNKILLNKIVIYKNTDKMTNHFFSKDFNNFFNSQNKPNMFYVSQALWIHFHQKMKQQPHQSVINCYYHYGFIGGILWKYDLLQFFF